MRIVEEKSIFQTTQTPSTAARSPFLSEEGKQKVRQPKLPHKKRKLRLSPNKYRIEYVVLHKSKTWNLRFYQIHGFEFTKKAQDALSQEKARKTEYTVFVWQNHDNIIWLKLQYFLFKIYN